MPSPLTSPKGAGATRAAVIKAEDTCDVRGAQVPSLANVDTGGPERRDGGQPTPAEGKPGTQQAGGLSPDHSRALGAVQRDEEKERGPHLP